MLEFLRSIPLTGTTAQAITWLIIVGFTAILLIAQPRGRRRRFTAISLAIGLIVTAIVLAVLVFFFGITLDEVPYSLILAGALTITALSLAVTAIIGSWKKLWSVAPVSLVLVGCLLVGNQSYGLYPDVESLFPDVSYNEIAEADLPRVDAAQKTVPVEQWRPSADMPKEGTRVSMHIPTPASGFAARTADVYLPPAWFSNPRPALPVLVLMHGIPGAPEQWFDEAGALKPAVNYQNHHDGLAPIIVSIDATGGWVNNPVCTDSPKAKFATYITKDVPQFLVNRLGANKNQRSWTLGGLSYGGTCSLQTVANNPSSYGTFLDYSGEFSPNDGESHASTVRDFFNNSDAEFTKHNPADILTAAASGADEFSQTAGRFVAGASDHSAQRDLKKLSDLATQAGIEAPYRTVPGGHDFRVWRTALAQDFAWVAERGGLPK